jgi:hypothetical protein
LEPFARDCGYDGPPFRWDEARRFLLRAELDAAFFHLYLPVDAQGDWLPASPQPGTSSSVAISADQRGSVFPSASTESPEDLARLKAAFTTPRDAVAYILDTFPIVRRKDIDQHGEYRTQRVILEIYDALAESTRTGQPYQTRLDPPPADPRVAHPPREAL